MLKQEEMTKLNRDFRIVFTEKKEIGKKRKRHFVSANTLKIYIGEDNANKLIESMKSISIDKVTVRFRKYGKIEIYCK
jgi:hypothetical protein